MKNVAAILMVLVLAISTFAQSGRGNFTLKKRNGYSLEVSLIVRNSKVREVLFDLWQPIGRSFHECGIEGKRGDGKTTWTDEGSQTTVEYPEYGDAGTVTITKRSNGKLLIEACGTAVLFTPRGSRYYAVISR